MIKKVFITILITIFNFGIWGNCDFEKEVKKDYEKIPFNIGSAILSTKQIHIEKYPEAYNPSLIQIPEGFLLVFRHLPDPKKLWISNIGVVLLNENLEQISEPQLLKTRKEGHIIPSQSEDARIFEHNGKLYLIYNDNLNFECPGARERRDMYIVELSYANGEFVLSEPIMLFHEQKYHTTNWQKNWVPFSWNGLMLLSYCILPHEVLSPDFSTGGCTVCYQTTSKMPWKWGELRGGTPALLVEGEYLAFFHSATITTSASSRGKQMWHYFMGAYTFSADPPFTITKMTHSPIIGKKFYTSSSFHKRVIFPGGFIKIGSQIYLAYGKDDSEVWIATIDYEKLKKILIPLDQ